MAIAKSYEELEIWKRGRKLCKRLYEVSAVDKFARDFALRDQLRRAGISIPLNIAEGFSRRSRKEFRRFLLIARGSLAEVQTCLYLALDFEYIDQTTFQPLYVEIDEISRMISSMIRTLC